MKHIKLFENRESDDTFARLRKHILGTMDIDPTDELESILSIAAAKLDRDRDELKIRKFSAEEFPEWQPVRDPAQGWKMSGSINLNFAGVSDDTSLNLVWGNYPGYRGRRMVIIGRYGDFGYRTEWVIE